MLPLLSLLILMLLSLSQPKVYSCNECEKRFRSQAKLNEHKTTVHVPIEDKTCKHCHKPYASTVLKARHEKYHCLMVLPPAFVIDHPKLTSNWPRFDHFIFFNRRGKL
jgi:hypothetical protein